MGVGVVVVRGVSRLKEVESVGGDRCTTIVKWGLPSDADLTASSGNEADVLAGSWNSGKNGHHSTVASAGLRVTHNVGGNNLAVD